MKKSIFGILIALMLCLTGCGTEPIHMTQEEYDAYIESITHEYKVVSVYQYISTETNPFGGVTDQELNYCFSYVGDDGELNQFDGFHHTEYGLWKVRLGEENKYVVRHDSKTLYLTEETLNNMLSD